MKPRFLLPITLSLVVNSALGAGEDVTMQVLDDAREVDAVLKTLRAAPAAAVPHDDARTSRRARARAPAETPYSERSVEARANDRLSANLDREEQSEGEIEDFDVPEDLEIPESAQD